MTRKSFFEPSRGVRLGGALGWLAAVGCGGTTGRENLARLALDDASTDSSVDSGVPFLDASADMNLDEGPHRRKPGALGDADLSVDDSGLALDARTEGGDGSTAISCGYGMIASHPDCDSGCTNHCTLPDSCYECVLNDDSASQFLPFCSKIVGVAADGPAKGEQRTTLCSELLDCAVRTGCGFSDTTANCYCGTAAQCFKARLGPNEGGPCRDQVENAAETTEPALIQGRYQAQSKTESPQNLALGAVMKVLRLVHMDCNIDCPDTSVDGGN